jgi:ABC-type Fe3+-citrate transport system substrate-binding protein
VLLVEPDGMRMASSRSFAGSVLSDLGLARRPDPGDEEEPSFTTLQPDRVAALKADMILLSVAPRAGGAARRLQSSAAWRGLDGRVERVDPSIWWGPGGILAGRAALADLQRILQP